MSCFSGKSGFSSHDWGGLGGDDWTTLVILTGSFSDGVSIFVHDEKKSVIANNNNPLVINECFFIICFCPVLSHWARRILEVQT